jgi:hypothetical protein
MDALMEGWKEGDGGVGEWREMGYGGRGRDGGRNGWKEKGLERDGGQNRGDYGPD